MTERIVIEGQMVRHIREVIVSEAPMASLRDHLVEYRAATFPILPSTATRYLEFDPNTGNGALLVERPPQMHHIRVYHGSDAFPDDAARVDDGERIGIWHVQLPYTYWLFPFTATQGDQRIANFSIRNAIMLFRKEPYRTPEDLFHYATVPNVDAYGNICWGGTVQPRGSFNEHIDALVNEFFITTFNSDLGHRTPFDTSLTEWEAASEQPLSWLNWDLWNTEPGFKLEDLRDRWTDATVRDAPRDIASFSPSFVMMPPLPENFTVLRAMQWLQGLPDITRFRLDAAMQQLTANEDLHDANEEIAEAEA